jgi:hypothetical protein
LESGRCRRSLRHAGIVFAFACAGLLGSAASASAAGSIAGKIIDADSKAPLAAFVCASNEAEELRYCGQTDSFGKYLLADLEEADYIVEFAALNRKTQYYDGTESILEADPVSVTGNPVTGIDAELVEFPIGSIEGRVTDAGTGAGLAGVEVCASGSTTEGFGCVPTGSDGKYLLPSLTPDDYLVEFWGAGIGYSTLFYDGATSTADADLVHVVDDVKAVGINGALSKLPKPPPEPLPTTPVTMLTPPPLVTQPPTAKPKGKKCRKGFRVKRIKGKKHCVKIKKRRPA